MYTVPALLAQLGNRLILVHDPTGRVWVPLGEEHPNVGCLSCGVILETQEGNAWEVPQDSTVLDWLTAGQLWNLLSNGVQITLGLPQDRTLMAPTQFREAAGIPPRKQQ